MVRSRTPSQERGSHGFEMERKYSVPSNPDSRIFAGGTASEDLHAWSIYRYDNINFNIIKYFSSQTNNITFVNYSPTKEECSNVPFLKFGNSLLCHEKY